MKKICLNCGGENNRPRSQFCSIPCQMSHWHKQHPEKNRESQKKRRLRIAIEFNAYKESMGCSSCGYKLCGAALDFHHTRDKLFNINADEWVGTKARKRDLEAERAKCVLLCKNCHTELHCNEEGRWKPLGKI